MVGWGDTGENDRSQLHDNATIATAEGIIKNASSAVGLLGMQINQPGETIFLTLPLFHCPCRGAPPHRSVHVAAVPTESLRLSDRWRVHGRTYRTLMTRERSPHLHTAHTPYMAAVVGVYSSGFFFLLTGRCPTKINIKKNTLI